MRKILIFVLFLLMACNSDEKINPKPQAFLRLEYPPHDYEQFENHLPFSFEKSRLAKVETTSDTTFNLSYPLLKARFYFTYSPVRNNLQELLIDAENLTYKHAIKADDFYYEDFADPDNRIFARINYVTGNAASPVQFHITDSLRHFITASLYFRAVPNYDSVRPALEYLKADVKHMVESWRWK